MRIKIMGQWQEIEDTFEGGYLPMVELEDGTEWYVAKDAEAAGKANREYWEEMANNDPKEFARIVGEETLIKWGLGQWAGPGSAQVRSLAEWLDAVEGCPEEQWASWDGNEIEVEDCDDEAEEEIGFRPTVAYRHN